MCVPSRSVAFAVLLSLVAFGCGGGGGGGGAGTPNGEFQGAWHYLAMHGQLVPPDAGVVTAESGRVHADDSGGFDLTCVQNVNGVVGLETTYGGLAYALAADGSLTWTLSPASVQPVLGGAVSDTGRHALLSAISDGSIPSVRVLLRRDGTFSAASLSGDYHTVSLSYVPPSDVGFVGETTYDGLGGCSGSGTTNREGLHQFALTGASYVVTPEGDLTFTRPTVGLRGGVLEGGDVLVLGGGTSSGESSVFHCEVRKASGASLLTFAGTYHLVLLVSTDLGYFTYAGDVQADGAGGWTAQLLVKAIGSTGPPPPGTEAGSYAVLPDGRFTFSFVGSEPLQGGLSADGDFAVLGGPLTGTTKPMLAVLVRR